MVLLVICILVALILLILLGSWNGVLLGFVNDDVVREWNLRTHFAVGIMSQQDRHLDAEYALAHEHVPHGRFDVVALWFTSGDQVTVFEFHPLRTLGAKFTTDDHFAAFRTVLHDEAYDTVARTSHGESAEKLVTQRLTL